MNSTHLMEDNCVSVNLSIYLLSKIANTLENHDKLSLAFVCKRWMASIEKIVVSFKLDHRFKITKDLNDMKRSSMKIYRNLFINSLLSNESKSVYIDESTLEEYRDYLNDYIIKKVKNIEIESHVDTICLGWSIPVSFMKSFSSFIEKHPNINKIVFEQGFKKSLVPNAIPQQIRKVVFNDVKAKVGSLPETLEHLRIISRGDPISEKVIPKSLRKLYIEGDIPQIQHLPSRLENLSFNPISISDVNLISLPDTLIEIYIPGFIVPKLKNMPLLKVLGIVGEQCPLKKPLPFEMSDIPPSVTTLDFVSDIFDIPNGIFPPTLRNLHLGNNYYDLTKIKGLVPFFGDNSHFDNLSMGKTLTELKANQLPSSVLSLAIVNPNHSIKYHTGCFPISLGMEKLSLTWPSDNIVGLIPNTVKELSITFPSYNGFRPMLPGEVPDSVEILTLKNLNRIVPDISIPSSVKKLNFKYDLQFRNFIPGIIKWIEEFLPNQINIVYIDDFLEMKRLYADQFILLRYNTYKGKFNNGVISLNKLSSIF